MYYREHKGFILEVQEYEGDSKNDIRYSGKCEELGFESKNRELSSLMVNFYRFIDVTFQKEIQSALSKLTDKEKKLLGVWG